MNTTAKKNWNEYGEKLADAALTMQNFAGSYPLELQQLIDAYTNLGNREKAAGADLALARSSKDEMQRKHVGDLKLALEAIHFEMALMTEAPLKKRQAAASKFHDRVAEVLGISK